MVDKLLKELTGHVDKSILKYLPENARENVVVIAEKLGLTTDIVKYRMNKLTENKIIRSFRAVIDRKILGY